MFTHAFIHTGMGLYAFADGSRVQGKWSDGWPLDSEQLEPGKEPDQAYTEDIPSPLETKMPAVCMYICICVCVCIRILECMYVYMYVCSEDISSPLETKMPAVCMYVCT